ncbi:hypothetical protein L0U85_00785 [Glycomyces sp. L485]|uniref:hypothetical protein n=1 Tax=Glycomyces sp. L485 TaxID=2909235 RepID=UPI001F4A9E74|nr:hypothetical protein [Glycomyces sp. L485]MCH7229405.1 hypothetical protein [Glycomyces sp. L485]
MAERRREIRLMAGGLLLAAGLTACDAGSAGDDGGEDGGEDDHGVLYGVGDDHTLWRWEVGSDEVEAVFDLGGVWEREGDVGAVLRASLSVAPDQRHASWIAGGGPNAELQIGDLESGEISGTVPYPVDHACLDPVWAPEGKSLLVHRTEVWGAASQGDGMPGEVWGSTEWLSPEGDRLPSENDLEDGCRLRWYEADGAVEGIYHDLGVSELYRVDETGERFETISLDELGGVEPEVTGLVAVDPSGRYVCLADGYDEFGTYGGGFTIRPQTGTKVIDLASGETAGKQGATCESLAAGGYLSRGDTEVELIDYQGESKWKTSLPPEIENSPNLFYFSATP